MVLKFCPFCGSKLLSLEMLPPLWGGREREPVIVCDDCGASAPVEKWNQRKLTVNASQPKLVAGNEC